MYKVKRSLIDTVYIEAENPEEAKAKAEWNVSVEEGQSAYVHSIVSVEVEDA